MAITEALRLVVDADTRGAVQGIENLGRTADRELSRSKTSLDKWGHSLTNIGAGMIGLGSVALVGLGAAAMASEEAQLAVVKLENTLKNMPKLAGESSKQFIDLAESIQSVTAADADAIVEAEALLGTFQLTATEIKGITPLVVDYARKFGIDIPDAAVQVGKALDGQVGALKRNGVSIDEAAFATDRYTAVQKALSEQVGGFAEAEGKTFAGSVQRMKNELGDLAEGVGVGAVDAFSSMFGVIEGVTRRLGDLSPEAQSAIGKFATFGATGLVVAGGMSVLIGQIILARERFSDAIGVVRNLTTQMGGLSNAAKFLAGPTALLAVGIALDQFHKAQERSTIDAMTDDFLAAGTSASAMNAALTELAGKGATEFVGTFEKLASTNREAAERFVDQLEAAGAAESVIRQMRGALETTAAAERQTAEDTQGATDAMDEQTGATEEATSALQEYSNELKAMTDPLFGAMDAITGNRDAQLAYSDAVAGVMTAQAELDAAIANHGPTSTEAAEATRGLEDAQRGLEDAQWATVTSAAEVDSALAALQDAVAVGDVSVDKFRDTLRGWVAQGFLTQGQADAAAAAVGGLASEAAAADALRVDLPVNAPGASQALAEVANLKRQVESLDGQSATVTIKQLFTTVGQAFGFGGGRASGGPVAAGRLYEVAEQGRAELLEMAGRTYLIPGSDGTVVPAGAWSGGGGGGGGYAPTYVINVNGGLDSASSIGQNVVEKIKAYERSNGPGWRN